MSIQEGWLDRKFLRESFFVIVPVIEKLSGLLLAVLLMEIILRQFFLDTFCKSLLKQKRLQKSMQVEF